MYLKKVSHVRSVKVHTFFYKTGNNVNETMQQEHLKKYVNIYYIYLENVVRLVLFVALL